MRKERLADPAEVSCTTRRPVSETQQDEDHTSLVSMAVVGKLLFLRWSLSVTNARLVFGVSCKCSVCVWDQINKLYRTATNIMFVLIYLFSILAPKQISQS